MNIQQYVNAIDEAARTQISRVVDAVRTEQQRQFIDILDILMQNGNPTENMQRALPNFNGVDMGFVHNLQRKLKTYNEWYAHKIGVIPKMEDLAQKPQRGRPPLNKTEEK
jgi:hypothetical protein